MRNHEAGTCAISADALVSTDALALVRFGLRAPDDPRILDTVAVIDKVLKVDLPQGPGWRRYNFDGYGEKADGRPFDGVGVGRVWPLLAGERAHYALAAGRRAEAEALLATIEAQTSSGGLIPEQVWDGPPIPSQGARARASRPVRRCRSCGRMPNTSSCCGRWRTARCSTCRRMRRAATCTASVRPAAVRGARIASVATIPAGRVLRLDFAEPAIVLYTRDDWATQVKAKTKDTGLGLFVAEIATEGMAAGQRVVFTWRDRGDRRVARPQLRGRDHRLRAGAAVRSRRAFPRGSTNRGREARSAQRR